jgi:hypothetical protein
MCWKGSASAALVVVVALTACGGAATIDASRVEKAIEVSIARSSHRLSIVVCPTGVQVKKGNSFTCTATLGDGSQHPFHVTQTDDRGDVRYTQVQGGTGLGQTKSP